MKIGDRVENIVSDFGQPVGLNGVIIGECWRDADQIMFNVQWDGMNDDWPYSTKELILCVDQVNDPRGSALYYLRKALTHIRVVEGEKGYEMSDDIQNVIEALEHEE